MKKSSQIQSVDATAIPQCVSVAMAEIAENMHEGLLALAVGAGLQVMAALMEADVSALAGPKGKHDAMRTAVRHGRERGSVTLGGRRVAITRPRVRAAGGSGELPIASYELFSSTEILGKMAMEKMLAGLSTRRYPVGLEPVGGQGGTDRQMGMGERLRRQPLNWVAINRIDPGWLAHVNVLPRFPARRAALADLYQVEALFKPERAAPT